MFLAWWFNRWSLKEDLEGHDVVHGKMSAMAGPGLLFFGFSTTFMAVDWILSVDPKWFSTIFGMLFMVNQALTAMAFLITLMVILYQQRPMSEVLTHRHLHDLGKFLLALVMVWAYFSFSQFLIIWAGNLPEEIPWYLTRLNGGWQFVGLLLVVGHFALPFALLLSRDLKRNFKLLSSIAIFILLMRFVDLYWLITPACTRASVSASSISPFPSAWWASGWRAYPTREGPLMPKTPPPEGIEHGRD
jgi:hypothetical protein